MSNSPPVHLLWPRTGSPLKRIACGTTVNGPSHWTTELRKASCYECARQAEGLTAERGVPLPDNEPMSNAGTAALAVLVLGGGLLLLSVAAYMGIEVATNFRWD